MADVLRDKVLKTFKLNDKQHQAAVERVRDVVVTAGAGSGKTLTLVARYTSLLAEGMAPRRIAAITFTKKAAREMRSRVRQKLMEFQQLAINAQEQQKWMDLSAQMDSARIGTIHSLCSEILRAYPAEAGVDPRFEVADEGLAAALRMQAVEDTLNTLVEQDEFLPLLLNISVHNLTQMLNDLLDRRLEADEIFSVTVENQERITSELKARMSAPSINDLIRDLRNMSEIEMQRDAGEKLAEMVKELLDLWAYAEQALQDHDPIACAAALYQARRTKMDKRLGKKDSMVKAMIVELRDNFEKLLNPLTGGENSKDPLPSVESEALFEQLLVLLKSAFDGVHQAYQELLDNRQFLDFDDLEYYALQLLQREYIRSRWQSELDAVLVDEFQDTNRRQRQIIQALTGQPGQLFIVGDMRQSIYRFRHADVTVFKDEQTRIQQAGGLVIDLDLTYRAHEPLLQTTGDLLKGVIGTQPDPDRKYYVPYSELVAHHKNPPQGIHAPHVEILLGAGADAESARPLAAHILAERLHQLKEEGQINKWDEVALLFRASTGFANYEQALEEAGIPFVTVAGRGFYERPEIRDLVNILRALADPLDDLSFAGLLRSPAFGMSDASLFILRQTGQPYWNALQGDLSCLDASDLNRAERARQIVFSLRDDVDSVPVAELIKKVMDMLAYRAILASADMKSEQSDSSAAGGRLWRNLDKLIEDAQVNSQTTVSDFLERLQVLNDAGAREGEAPSEAEGAVCLMSIHKAKGLEFPVVVLADAGRRTRTSNELVYLSDDLGVTFKLEAPPMLYKLAKAMDQDQDQCEELRLLYVAMTRAKKKLLINAHAQQTEEGGIKCRAWADKVLGAAGLYLNPLLQANGQPFESHTASQQALRVCCRSTDMPLSFENLVQTQPNQIMDDGQTPLYPPIRDMQDIEQSEIEQEKITADQWLASRHDDDVPGDVLGRMVHKAIQQWLFPGDPGLKQLLATEAIHAGLGSAQQRLSAERRAFELLGRFHKHPIWMEIDSAQERYFELSYVSQVNQRTEIGYIDLLYSVLDTWHILEFKADSISSASQREKLVEQYRPQIQRYHHAVRKYLGVEASASLCFLDDHGQVELMRIF